MIKNYYCPNCKRDIDYVVNTHSPDLYLCIITKGCPGILEPIKTKPGTFSKFPTVTNLIDWIPRGSTQSFNELTTNIEFVNISSSFYNDIVIHSPNQVLTSLTFNETNIIDNKQDVYVYQFNGELSTLTGPDSTSYKNVLRINDGDLVKILVNGIETTEFEKTNSSITFIPKISGNLYIEIYVIRFDSTANKQIEIQPNTINVTPWNNTNLNHLYVFSLSSFSNLKGYQLITNIPNGKLLLSKSPYSGIDQIDNCYIDCQNLTNYNIVLRTDENGYTVATVPNIALTQLIRPLDYKRDNTTLNKSINIENETQQIKSSFIIGPV